MKYFCRLRKYDYLCINKNNKEMKAIIENGITYRVIEVRGSYVYADNKGKVKDNGNLYRGKLI